MTMPQMVTAGETLALVRFEVSNLRQHSTVALNRQSVLCNITLSQQS